MFEFGRVDEFGMKPFPDDKAERDTEFKDDELKANQERNKNKKTLFYSVLGSSAILVILAMIAALWKLVCGDISTEEVFVITLMLTAPIILILAMMRYIFDGKKVDDPHPTLMLNVGKELASVAKDIFKK